MTSTDKIEIQINGEKVSVSAGACLSDLIVEIGIDNPAIAVEVNSVITSQDQFDSLVINSGDVVEIVSLVGGG